MNWDERRTPAPRIEAEEVVHRRWAEFCAQMEVDDVIATHPSDDEVKGEAPES